MKKKYNKKQILSLAFYLCAIGTACFFFLFLVSVNIIGYSVKDKCHLAQEKYEGDCAQALIAQLEDEENGFAIRNNTIWALGQLGDERALPVLRSYYTVDGAEYGNRSKELSQFELGRAISYFEGNPNITTFFWRFGEGIDRK